MTSRKYFGTDGIRGRVGTYPMTPDFVMQLGLAAGKVLVANNQVAMAHGQHPSVLIGKDTRVSGYMLEAALEAGLSAAGVDVVLAGPMPTPAVAYLVRALRLSAGIVISASHNPYDDNGIKFFSAQGTKLSDDIELAIEHELEASLNKPMSCVSSDLLGKARRLDDAAGRYIEFCKSTFPSDLDLKGLKIVVDSAHGAAYHVAQHVLHELGAEVVAIGNQPNGFNINDGFGATAPDALAISVRANQADLGIALDGDADRLVMVDAQGKIVDGDGLLYMLVKSYIEQTGLIKGVVGTLMTNIGFEQRMASMHIPFVRAKVGDRYVLEQLHANGWVLGGETSGHLLCLDKHSTGDGLVSALQILAYLVKTNQTLAQAVADLTLCPQVMVNVRLPAVTSTKSWDWKTNQHIQLVQSTVETDLQKLGGRLLLRASGTEPLIRVMVEASTTETAQTMANLVANTIRDEGAKLVA
jgi:phosphoglucosamine mutase